MAAFHDAIEMASSDDEDIAGSAGGDDHHHPDFIDDELPFLEPAARADMVEGSDGEAEGVELPGLASEESEGEDEHARPPPPPVLPARQGDDRRALPAGGPGRPGRFLLQRRGGGNEDADDDAHVVPGFLQGFEDESDDEDEPQDAEGPGGRRRPVPLHHLLRLVAGGGLLDRPMHSHDRLLDSLRQQGILRTSRIFEAMQACPRDAFVIPAHRREALVDAPIRVAEHGFNISAPHMHACCLEALQLGPGHKFLDVGSGCGVLTACGAVLVGRGGCAVGIDVRPAAVDMATASVRRLAAASPAFAAKAAPVAFQVHNVFMPAAEHLGRYDRIHVGASCPLEHLGRLTALLGPEGGCIVTPVAPSDLRLISVSPAGVTTQRVLSQVRYGELEVPGDAEIMIQTLARERPPPAPMPPSDFPADIGAILAGAASPSATATPSAAVPPKKTLSGPPSSPVCALDTPFGSSGSDASSALSRRWSLDRASSYSGGGGQSPSPPGSWGGRAARSGRGGSLGRGSGHASSSGGSAWGRRVVDFFTSCSDPRSADELAAAGEGRSDTPSSGEGEDDRPSRRPDALDPAMLGPPDCLLVGAGWSFPVHRAVLCVRCELLRARCSSGMRDASAARVQVPEHFARPVIDAFVAYLYKDTIDMDMEPAAAAAVLQVGLYYGAARLIGLCEVVLSRTLTDAGVSLQEKAEAAPALLSVADESGLPALRAIALDWLVHNYAAAAATPAFQALSKPQTDMIAASACSLLGRYHDLLHSLAHVDSLPSPSKPE